MAVKRIALPHCLLKDVVEAKAKRYQKEKRLA